MRTANTLALALVVAASVAGCRNPVKAEPWAPDAGEFDAAPDDAGPGELCPPDTPDLFNNAHSPYFGGEQQVELEVVNFSFFRCPHCANFAEWAREEWATNDEYRDRVRVFFHHFPFSSEIYWEIHAATVAAANQGMDNFWAMHDYLYDGMNAEPEVKYEPDELREFADQELGLDMEQYDADVVSAVTYGYLEWDRAQLESLGYSSTPSIFVCGEKLGGWTSLDETLDSYLGL
jgi:protein-disulfide isomerase